SVVDFLNSVSDVKRREDCFKVLDIMSKETKSEAKMWGSSIVGFGTYHYKYKSGQEGDWFIVGFSPRKVALTLYIVPYISEQEELIKKLGKVKTGKSCIYVKNLEDIDLNILKKLIKISMKSI
ncbi:MAG: DUF1801 domain-containing protein, partial [Nanoarchaeota archaeon]|nr:DUF1801 domain-containing protein [Nanoarchaeota archaeon]